jgi:hypothetical protein
MGAMFDGCPGAVNIRGTPTLEEKACPKCGESIEIFSVDMQAQCKCGFVAYNEIQNCVNWCKYARECVGEEAYERIKNIKENSV